MKKFLFTLLFCTLPLIASAQMGGAFGSSGGGTSVSTMLPIIADSTLWHLQGTDTLVTDGALPVKVSGLRVSGTTRLDGNLTMNTTAAESVKVLAGGIRNEGGLLQKGAATFGATGTPVYITADGKVGIGTATSSPYNAFGLVSSTSGRGTGIGLTSAQWNKNRTNWVTASDTSAIGMYIDSAGWPRWFMRAADGDTLGLWPDGSQFICKSDANIIIDAKAVFAVRINGTSRFWVNNTMIYPQTNLDLGSTNATQKFGNINMNGVIYQGGKGMSPAWILSIADVRTEKTDSCFVHELIDAAPTVKAFDGNGVPSVSWLGLNSQSTNLKQATVLLTIGPVAAATDTCLNLIPAGSMVIGVTTRVITAVTGDAGFTGFSVGTIADPDAWGANLTPTVNETSDLTDCTITSVPLYPTATSVILTQVGGSSFATGGVVRVTVHYISLTAPTS